MGRVIRGDRGDGLAEQAFDVIVVGSGAAGLAAALTAAAGGATVLVLEKCAWLGGTTAYSEAMIWAPCSAQARAAGVADTPEAALAYLAAVTGRRFDRARCEAFVTAAPQMLAFVEANSAVRYRLATGSVDYYPDLEGASRGARSLSPGAFDGRRLGAGFNRIRPPLRSAMVLGGMSITSADLPHFYRVFRSWRSTARVTALSFRYALDRLRGWSRGTAIGNGDGVVAALVEALVARGATLVTDTPAETLIVENRRVLGVVARIGGGPRRLAARQGVILATGGFSANPALRERYAPQSRRGESHLSLVAEGATGDGIVLAQAAGGAVREDLDQPMAWAPVSWMPHRATGFPHFMERAKPGIIAVDQAGRRFTNEAIGYHDIVPAIIAASEGRPRIGAWIIADHAAQRRYGLGGAPPAPGRLGPAIRAGYLLRAPTLAALARRIGVDPPVLEQTVAWFNQQAREGDDPDFGRGRSAHNRAYGDPRHHPNPCLGALEKGPFYAVWMQPGDLGSLVGLAVDADARVLTGDGEPIAGLYAVGLDAAGVAGGHYPAAGTTVGTAMTFGWIAARHATGTGGETVGEP